MLRRIRVRWASIAPALIVAGLFTGALTAQNGPSLDETLKWLKDFLPKATGGQFIPRSDAGHPFSETTQFGAVDGCDIQLMFERVRDGQPAGSDDSRFSLANINPASVIAQKPRYGGWDETDPEVFEVYLETLGKKDLIPVHNGLGNPTRSNHLEILFFTDRSSADRVANAFRHAAELCAKSQPF